MEAFDTERQRRQPKRKKKQWPKWLRKRFLIRWLFLLGPILFRLWRLFHTAKSFFDG